MKNKSKKSKKMSVKEKSLKKNLGVYHLLVYVEGCSSKLKKFYTVEDMNAFIFQFVQDHPDQINGDNWIDYAVTDIVGEVLPFGYSSLDLESA